jgi:hypothetical protein
MVFHNVPRLHGLVGCGVLIAAAAAPIGCGDDEFSGCEASRTCSPAKGGGEAGGPDTGGSSGSGSGRSGSGGGGTGGSSAGRSGASGDAGAGGSPDGEGGEGGSEPPPDNTPPTILSVSPENGSIGVRADTDLVVTFSEPMDRVSTQAAYQSTDIPAGGVAFSWNSESTVLTVSASSDLLYAEGSNANDVMAREYAAMIATTAEDEAGNRLEADFGWSFRTMRRITQTFTTGPLNWIMSSGLASNNLPCPSATAVVGDTADNIGRHLLVSRDISGLPDGIDEFEAATLSASQDTTDQATFDAFGPILTRHVSALPPTSVTWATPTLHTLDAFSTGGPTGQRSVDARIALADDYEHRAERNRTSQYRLGFERITTNADDTVNSIRFGCASFVLTGQYLIP